MTRLVTFFLAVLLLASCSFSLNAAVRNSSHEDITVLVGNRQMHLAVGEVSKPFDVPRWTNDPGVERTWEISVRSGNCLYRYPTPGLRTSSGRFPPEPLIIIVGADFGLTIEYPATWKAIGLEVVGLPAPAKAECR